MLLSKAAVAQFPAFAWASGGEKPKDYDQQAQARGVATDAAGNTYVVGTFRQTLTLGATTLTSVGDYDVFVAKLNAEGVYQWAVRAGGRGEDIGNGITLDAAGHLYITGNTDSWQGDFGAYAIQNPHFNINLFVAKLDANGQWLQLAQTLGDNSNNFVYGNDLVVDAAGNVYVTGGLRGYHVEFGSTTVFNEGGYNAFVAKLSPSGEWLWAVVEGGLGGYDFGNGIDLDASGNVYVTGNLDGYYGRFGTTILRKTGEWSSMFVTKLDPAGNWLWAVLGGGTARTLGNDLIVDKAASSVYVVGNVAGQLAAFGATSLPKTDRNNDVVVAKLSTEGAWQWAVRGGGPENDLGMGIALGQAGNVTITGSFSGARVPFGILPVLTSVGKSDVLVAQLDAAGSWRWALGGGGNKKGENTGLGIALTPQGDALVAGTFKGPAIRLGETEVPGGAAYYDYFADRFFATRVTNLQDRSAAEFTVWPNPSRGTVWAAGLEPNQPVQVFDTMGRLVISDARPAYDIEGLQLPNLKPGVYLVRSGKQMRRITLE
ncbi:hypothetical protein GCM10027348_09760 [Hymenobacter tenuis]